MITFPNLLGRGWSSVSGMGAETELREVEVDDVGVKENMVVESVPRSTYIGRDADERCWNCSFDLDASSDGSSCFSWGGRK